MGSLLDSLKEYFENTPKDVLDKDWQEIEYLNEIGPDVMEYAEFVKQHFCIEVSCFNMEEEFASHKYEVSVDACSSIITADAQYCFAA